MRSGWERPESLVTRPVLTNRMREYFTYGSVGGVGRKPGPYPAFLIQSGAGACGNFKESACKWPLSEHTHSALMMRFRSEYAKPVYKSDIDRFFIRKLLIIRPAWRNWQTR